MISMKQKKIKVLTNTTQNRKWQWKRAQNWKKLKIRKWGLEATSEGNHAHRGKFLLVKQMSSQGNFPINIPSQISSLRLMEKSRLLKR